VVKQKQLDKSLDEEPLVASYPKWYDDFVLYEAKHGHPDPLVARLKAFLRNGGERLTDAEIEFVLETLRATERKRGKDRLREAEQAVIAMQVEQLMHKGMRQKEAIAEVMEHKGCSRRHVFGALKKAKEKAEREKTEPPVSAKHD
jgi:hypothetical protein